MPILPLYHFYFQSSSKLSKPMAAIIPSVGPPQQKNASYVEIGDDNIYYVMDTNEPLQRMNTIHPQFWNRDIAYWV